MRAQRSGTPLRSAARLLGAGLLALALLPAAAAAAPPQTGVLCTTGPTFTLTVTDGYITLPDGNTMYMWGFAPNGGPFQHPGPTLCVNQGDTVTVILQNPSPQPVSIIFPGQTDVLADSAPAQPQFDGTGRATSLTNVAAANGGSVTYSFVAGTPGTFLYESGTNPQTQVRMGLFGALIVRPGAGADFASNRTDSQFKPDEEFMVLLSEIDPYQHWAVEAGQNFDITTYHPRYWLVNGRGFPDSIADNNVPWLPSQPYGALARIHPWTAGSAPGRIHYLNVGTEDFPFHPHGNNGVVIGRDGGAFEDSAGQDLSFEKFAINIGPGQTWDVLFRWYDAEAYSSANPVTNTIPSPANLQYGMFYSGSPYLGEMGPLLPGANTLNQCGEYYIITHNHALYQITSWGMTMSGAITYLRIDPPLPNSCPN
jgi:FtsP/CotA-like multicopper oxidase with cupredoxin domain